MDRLKLSRQGRLSKIIMAAEPPPPRSSQRKQHPRTDGTCLAPAAQRTLVANTPVVSPARLTGSSLIDHSPKYHACQPYHLPLPLSYLLSVPLRPSNAADASRQKRKAKTVGHERPKRAQPAKGRNFPTAIAHHTRSCIYASRRQTREPQPYVGRPAQHCCQCTPQNG